MAERKLNDSKQVYLSFPSLKNLIKQETIIVFW